MIREYAVDPDAVYRNLDSLQRFFADFRAENGRVIVGIPRNWIREQQDKIRELGLSDIARRKCFDDIEKLAKTSVIGGITIPTNIDSWILQARYAMNKYHINAIISTNNNIAGKEFDYLNLLENQPDNWIIDQTQSVQRNAQSISQSIATSLSIASIALYVDPYFHPTDERYRAPLLAMINLLRNGRNPCSKLYIHTTTQADKNRFSIESGLETHVKPLLQNGFCIELWIWPSQQLHDRFILTKNVGYSFGHGLDENTYRDAINVNINRISESARSEEYRKYSTEACRIGNPIVITG